MDPNTTYESAAKELDQILKDLENDQISIDVLAERVDKAGQLLIFCSDKLRTTENKVGEIIKRINL